MPPYGMLWYIAEPVFSYLALLLPRYVLSGSTIRSRNRKSFTSSSDVHCQKRDAISVTARHGILLGY